MAGDPEIVKLLDSTRIHLLPSMNPDGWKISTDSVILSFSKFTFLLSLQGATDYLLGRSNANNVDLNRSDFTILAFRLFTICYRDFPDLDQIVYEGGLDNNHLMRVGLPFSSIVVIQLSHFQMVKMKHRIQPETESVIKMIMDNPFVVRFRF